MLGAPPGQLDLRRILTIGNRASFAELSKPPLPRTTDSEVQQAWTTFGEAFTPREIDRFIAFADASSPSAEALGWAERTVWRVMPELDARHKKILLRIIAEETAVG